LKNSLSKDKAVRDTPSQVNFFKINAENVTRKYIYNTSNLDKIRLRERK